MRLQKSILLLCLIMTAVWCNANGTHILMGHSHIQIKERMVQGMPKGSSIEATIDGHTLTIVFLENLGQVSIDVTEVNGGETHYRTSPTPNGVIFYITDTGSYIVTFTLENGDEYYGEFEVTD